jgi:FixJ family two-component response regulator
VELNTAHRLTPRVRETARTEPTVFVIDDDTSARESLETLIRTAGWEPETFRSAEEFLSRSGGAAPCCLVCAVTLPGLTELALQRHLAARTDIPIIFISGYPDVRVTVQAMKSGAIEFLTKPFQDEVLLAAIRDGLERSSAALIRGAEMRMLMACYALLTPREREVMTHVVSGLLNKQIGAELGISEITVKAHRGQMVRKMEADSVPDLVMMAATLGLRVARPRALALAPTAVKVTAHATHAEVAGTEYRSPVHNH